MNGNAFTRNQAKNLIFHELTPQVTGDFCLDPLCRGQGGEHAADFHRFNPKKR